VRLLAGILAAAALFVAAGYALSGRRRNDACEACPKAASCDTGEVPCPAEDNTESSHAHR
jgi:hypothetical protein